MHKSSTIPLSAPMASEVSVVVPVYNESRTVGSMLERLLSAACSDDIIVVDDGSSDETPRILESWRKVPTVQVLTHERNLGKGSAIRTGLERAKNQFIIIQDADLEYDPHDIHAVVSPLIADEADFVFGSRRLDRHMQLRDLPNPFYHGVSCLNYLTWVLYGIKVSDGATCYKATRADLLRSMRLECERFEFCPEVTAKAARMRLRVREVPISYNRRTIVQGKKIRLRDWFHAARTLWRWRRWDPTACR